VVLANRRLKCRACGFGGSTELVHLVVVSVSLEKILYRLPFTTPLSGRLFGPSGLCIWYFNTLETGEGGLEQMLRLFGETARDSGKGHCTTSKETSVSLDKPFASSGKKVGAKDLNKKG
jgi:hypothetical protein